MMQDPFNDAFDALWDVLLKSAAIQQLVKPGNMIRDLDRDKPTASEGDLPEIMIRPLPSTAEIITTSSMQATENLGVYLSTDDEARKLLNRLRWEIIRAVITDQTLMGLPAVRNVVISSMKLSDKDTKATRGNLADWSCRIVVSVLMIFDLEDVTNG